ncbi:MAG TPA: hypothetical protein VL551_08070 [Actinospica sp.]|jgi:hypothetical protein|nr:hypothetical protein [Actinospica sp.]
MLSDYQHQLRNRFLAAPVTAPPSPWIPVPDSPTAIGGLQGIGFGIHPDNGHDLVMVVSIVGHGLFDATTGEKIARDRDRDPEPGRDADADAETGGPPRDTGPDVPRPRSARGNSCADRGTVWRRTAQHFR